MAKKTKEVKVLTKEELIEAAEKHWMLDRAAVNVQPKPTRFFEVGEDAIVGHLKNVKIEKVLYGGMAYVYSSLWTDRENPEGYIKYQSNWWFDVHKTDSRPEGVPRLMGQHRIFAASVADIESLLHHMNAGGLVVDPKYQRGYVWTEENKDALIESIFEHLDIGAFLLVRHHAYLHEGDNTLVTYLTLDGQEISVPRCEDYTVAIVDGQQRLTTIVNFVQNRRPYKGIYFSQMHWRDQIEFMNKSVAFRIINEEQTNEKEILRMFLQSNRGVPQSPEHIAKVQAMYDAMV